MFLFLSLYNTLVHVCFLFIFQLALIIFAVLIYKDRGVSGGLV